MAKPPKYSQLDLLDHIVELCDTTRSELADRSLGEFESDRNLVDATAYRLQAIGEACSKLNDRIKDAARTVPWKEIIGMRQILSHDYLSMSRSIVWQTARSNLEELRGACAEAADKERAREER